MRKIRPTHLRRSWLFVGAANDAHIEEASLSEADVCIQEFEDFCVPERRDYARNIMPEVLNTWERQGKVTAVRINPLEDPDGIKDLRAAISAGVNAVLLPKANYPNQIDRLIKYITELENEFGKLLNSTEVVPNIEQAEGLENTLSLLKTRPRVVAALVASEDMTVSLNAPRLKNSRILNYVRERFHVACCAAGVVSIDMPYTWNDEEGVIRQTELAQQLGMSSKSTVTSSHCEIINRIFSPTEGEAKQAAQIVSVFESARAAGKGQVDFGGIRIEVPTYLNSIAIIERYKALQKFD